MGLLLRGVRLNCQLDDFAQFHSQAFAFSVSVRFEHRRLVRNRITRALQKCDDDALKKIEGFIKHQQGELQPVITNPSGSQLSAFECRECHEPRSRKCEACTCMISQSQATCRECSFMEVEAEQRNRFWSYLCAIQMEAGPSRHPVRA